MSTKDGISPLRILCCTLLLAAMAARASEIGDPYAKVIAEKGDPKSQMQAGSMRVLSYPDATIKLKDELKLSIECDQV